MTINFHAVIAEFITLNYLVYIKVYITSSYSKQ